MSELAVNIARIFQTNIIPYGLWGWLAIAFLGHDNFILGTEVDFVVPDDKVSDVLAHPAKVF
ncbi:uncharacterized protein BDV14DRAFT_199532 [Aspergillus stella-maris]|uniref:uncharacterized protein n=1 Tax=Aspergillus stella-maris TaxID=1810926 RepID=UPI003CCD59E9